MDNILIQQNASTAWGTVSVIEAQLRYVQDESQRQLLLADLRSAQADAHYWQSVINQGKGWI